MEQLTKNQAVATSQEAVQNQNEPQLRDENAHNDKSVHGVLNPTYQAGLRRDRSEERRVGKEWRAGVGADGEGEVTRVWASTQVEHECDGPICGACEVARSASG